MPQNSTAPRSQEDYVTQVSEEIEGRVTKRLSQEFSRTTESRILGALARLDDFLMNPLLQGHSGTTPGMSRNVFNVNQGTNEDDSQSDPYPEAGLLTSGREDRHDMAMGVQRERAHMRMTPCNFTRVLHQKINGFFALRHNLVFPKFPKGQTFVIDADIQTLFLSTATGLISFIRD